MHTVAVLSLKGGVGKTTVTLGLAGAAHRRGLRCLVADLDPQCNSTVALEPHVGSSASDLAAVLAEPKRPVLRKAIAPSGWGEGLDVLLGSEDAEQHNQPDPGSKRLGRLRKALEKLPASPEKGSYDLILLDCPPSLGQLSRCGMVAAHRGILVTEPTMFAVAGVQRAFEAIHTEREQHNATLQPLGVLVNKFRQRSSEHQFRLSELREIFGPLVLPTVLPERIAVQQAQGACIPLHRWGTPGARQVGGIFDDLLDRIQRAGRSQRVARNAARNTARTS